MRIDDQFIEIVGRRAVHYVNVNHITSVKLFDDIARIFINEINIEDGYGGNQYLDMPRKVFEERYL